jgi:DNA-binding beta-propeller fold protein YncE
MSAIGCSRPYVPPDYSKYYWPKPPDKKRIQLLKILRTDLDIRRPSLSEELFGESAVFSFQKPFCVTSDKEGTIYVTDSYLDTIFKINTDLGLVKTFGPPGKWKKPKQISLDTKNGLMGLVDANKAAVLNLKTGRTAFTLKGNYVKRPGGIAFDPERKYVYVSDMKENAVFKFNHAGEIIGTIGGSDSEKPLYFPGDLEVDRQGNLFIVDVMNWRVQVFDPEGNFIRDFGGHGDKPGMFGRPKGIGVSKDGIVMISDADFNRITMFTETGQPLLVIGGAGTKPGQFITPQCIHVDDDDKFYIVDQTNRRVQIFQLMTDQFYRKSFDPIKLPSDIAQEPEEEIAPEFTPEEEIAPEFTPEEEIEPEFTPEEEIEPEFTPEEEIAPEITPDPWDE